MSPLLSRLAAKRLHFTSQWHSFPLVSRSFTTLPAFQDSRKETPQRPADTEPASGAYLIPTGAKRSSSGDSLRPVLGKLHRSDFSRWPNDTLRSIIIAGAILGHAALYFLTPSTTSNFGESIKERVFGTNSRLFFTPGG